MNDSREPLFGVQDPRGEMIRRIRRETRPLGWAMLLYLILGSFVSVVLLVICFQVRCMPELIESLTGDASSVIPSYNQIVTSAYDALQRFITSDFFSNAVAVIQVVSVAIAILPICLFARKRSLTVKADIPLKGVTLRDGAMMCAAMLGVNVFGSLGTLLTEGFFNLAGYKIGRAHV